MNYVMQTGMCQPVILRPSLWVGTVTKCRIGADAATGMSLQRTRLPMKR